MSSTLSTARFIEWFSGSARFLISLLFTSSPAGCSVYFNTVLDCLPTKCDTCPTNRHFPFCSSYRVFPLALNCRDGRVLPAQPGPHAQGCLPRGPSFPPPSSSLRSASSAPRWCSPRPEPFTLQNARTAVRSRFSWGSLHHNRNNFKGMQLQVRISAATKSLWDKEPSSSLKSPPDNLPYSRRRPGKCPVLVGSPPITWLCMVPARTGLSLSIYLCCRDQI